MALLGLLSIFAFKKMEENIAEHDRKARIDALIEMTHKLTDASRTLDVVKQRWLAWLNLKFDERESFGRINIGDVTVLRFQVLQSAVANLVESRDKKVIPLIQTAAKSHKMEDLNSLKAALLDYCKEVQKVSEKIKNNEPLMVAQGLPDMGHEIDATLRDLA